MHGRFCPICGKSIDYAIDGLCIECYRKSNPILRVPSELRLILCKSCFAYKFSGKWLVPPPVSSIDELVLYVAKKELMKIIKKKSNIESVNFDLEKEVVQHQERFTLIVKVKGRSHEKIPYSYIEEYAVPVKVNYVFCPACIDSRGKVERAVVQVRAKDRYLTTEEYNSVKSVISNAVAKALDENRDIVPLEIKGEKYLDITFSSLAAARKIASELQRNFPLKRMDTSKITGVSRTGKPQTKLTIRLLLPEFKKGDIVSISNKLYMVLAYEKDKVRVLSLSNYNEAVFSVKEIFSRAKIEAHSEDVEQVLVVAVTPPYIQLMDLKTFKVYEVRVDKVPLWIKEGENVGVADIHGRKVFLPL